VQKQFLQGVSGAEFGALEKQLVAEKEDVVGVFLTRWSICFQSSDDTRLSDLIWATIIHIYSSQKENVALLCDARCNGFHDLAIDRLFVVSHEVLVQQLLNLVW
jgi:hypothetical protein